MIGSIRFRSIPEAANVMPRQSRHSAPHTMLAFTAATGTTVADPTASLLRRTPAMMLGPFYPLEPHHDANDTLWRGATMPSGARSLRVQGQVLNLDSDPVVGATVELWHADPAGRYRHPSALESDLVVEGFVGYGRTRTTSDGRFSFASLVPGGYVDGRAVRAPHLHVQITGRFDRLVTQLFLPNHPGNAFDRPYQTLAHPERLTAEAVEDDAGLSVPQLQLRWTAVLTRG